jgi:chaperonin cofactor prefoldin
MPFIQAQTFDISANEVNFFIKDVTTNGSKIPFRIKAGVPSDTFVMAASRAGILELGQLIQAVVVKGDISASGKVNRCDLSVCPADLVQTQNDLSQSLDDLNTKIQSIQSKVVQVQTYIDETTAELNGRIDVNANGIGMIEKDQTDTNQSLAALGEKVELNRLQIEAVMGDLENAKSEIKSQVQAMLEGFRSTTQQALGDKPLPNKKRKKKY